MSRTGRLCIGFSSPLGKILFAQGPDRKWTLVVKQYLHFSGLSFRVLVLERFNIPGIGVHKPHFLWIGVSGGLVCCFLLLLFLFIDWMHPTFLFLVLIGFSLLRQASSGSMDGRGRLGSAGVGGT